MDDLLVFGDIFRYRGGEFIYLTGMEEIVYAAKILDAGTSRTLRARCERVAVTGGTAATRLESTLLYCFVVLRTPGYQERAAHYAQPGSNEFGTGIDIEKLCSLIPDDIRELKDSILQSNGVSEGVKDLIRSVV